MYFIIIFLFIKNKIQLVSNVNSLGSISEVLSKSLLFTFDINSKFI